MGTGDAESKVAENASVACAGDTKMAEKDLVVTHSDRLDVKLNFSVFQHEVLQNPDEACGMVRVAFKGVVAEMDKVTKDSCKDSTFIVQPNGAGNPSARVKALITDLITRLHVDSSSEMKGPITDLINWWQTDISHQPFYDDISSVERKGLIYQDCEVLFHVNKQSPDIAGGGR